MTSNVYILQHETTGQYATMSCIGQHDGKFSDDVADAKEFASYGEAADYSQNFDNNWIVVPLYADQPDVDMSRVYRDELPQP